MQIIQPSQETCSNGYCVAILFKGIIVERMRKSGNVGEHGLKWNLPDPRERMALFVLSNSFLAFRKYLPCFD